MAEIPTKVADGVEKTATAVNKVIDNIIGHIDYPLEHGDLFLIADDTDLGVFQEKVSRVP
jgi:hypothetical protein